MCAELAAASVAAQFLGGGAGAMVTTGIDVAKEVKVYMVDVLTRSLDRFDYEKVFVEGIVCTAIFAVIKIVYWIYSQIWITAYGITHPVQGMTDFLSFLGPFGQAWSLFNSLTATSDIAEDEKAKIEAERKKDFFLYYGKPIFEDYWVGIILGIWLIFILLEKRRVDLEHRKRKLLMRLAAQ